MRGVRKTAAVREVTRVSPQKIYGGVKSKVAGNMKSINRANKNKYAVAIEDQTSPSK